MKDWNAKDWCGFVICSGFILWGVLMMIGVLISGKPMAEKTTEIFVAVVVSLGGALGLHFGKGGGNGGQPK